MDGLEISPKLVGQKVCNAAKPEWGVGTVLRVDAGPSPGASGGQRVHRVTVQFPVVGSKTMVVPPARLLPPQAEAQRSDAGWLDSISGRGVDERLAKLPEDIEKAFGTTRQRLDAVLPTYRVDVENPAALVKWARRQTGVSDPLSQWSRDELAVAFGKFVLERDSHLRMLAARLKQAEGQTALNDWLAALPDEVRAGVYVALRRPL